MTNISVFQGVVHVPFLLVFKFKSFVARIRYYRGGTCTTLTKDVPGRVAQSVGRLTRKSGVLGAIPGLATYFRFSS